MPEFSVLYELVIQLLLISFFCGFLLYFVHISSDLSSNSIMFQYIQVSSPNVVEPWEAVFTVLQFPILMLNAYIQDIGWKTLCQSLCPSVYGSWKPLTDTSLPIYNGAIHDRSDRIYPEQSKPEWELVDLRYQPMPSSTKENRNGAASDDHQISPSVRLQVAVAIDGIDQLVHGELLP